jgi:hypothetical protein
MSEEDLAKLAKHVETMGWLHAGKVISVIDELRSTRKKALDLLAELQRLRKVEWAALAFAETAEQAVLHHETKGAGGQQVPFMNDFACATPSTVSRLRWWARRIRDAVKS